MEVDSASAHRLLAALLVIASISFFVGLGRPAISDTDEAYYAEAAREMVTGGDWLTPHYNGVYRWQKPVLYYWGSAVAYLATGDLEWASRVCAALSGVALVVLTWFAARALTSRNDSAFIAGAIVATCYGCFYMARQALPDLPLAFFINWTLWAAWRRRLGWAGFAAGLGCLMKGPLGIVIPALVLLPVWWVEHRQHALSDGAHQGSARMILARLHLSPARLMLGFVMFAVTAVPWYAAMAATHGGPFLQSFFVQDNLERFATTRFNGPRFVLYYLPVILGGLLPWTGYLLVLPWRTVTTALRHPLRSRAGHWLLACWVAMPLIFFTAAIGKQPRYILPVLMPLAIVIGHALATRCSTVRGESAGRTGRLLAFATFATAAVQVIVAALLLGAAPLLVTTYPPLTTAAVAALFATGVVLATVAARRTWHLLPSTLTGVALVTALAVQFGGVSGVRPEPVEQMAASIRQHRTAEPLVSYHVFARNLVVYTGWTQSELYSDEQAAAFLAQPARVLMAVPARDLPTLQRLSGLQTRTLAEVTYLDPARLRLGTLLAPDPGRDLDRVLLVANR